jgi:hypothetical protein
MIAPTDMIPPTRNISLDENGRRKRGGSSHVDGAALSGTPQIMGLYDFTMEDGTQYIIRACNDGKVYKDDTNTIDTGMSTTTFHDFETFEDELYIVDGNTVPQKWTGSGNTADVGDVPTDWETTNQPQWIVKHGRGNSERLWAGGVADQRGAVYASANGDGDDFSDANVITINIETHDGFGIVGAIEYGDRLLCFGKRKCYIIDDLDTNTANWGYDAAQWDGGTANFRTIVKTPNDVISMMEDGEIYSVLAAENYGDYKAASLARPAHMHRWIKEYVDLAKFDQFHMQYDSYLRAVKIFVVRSGQTQVDTALVFFIDRPPNEAWSVHSNQSYDSGYTASCSAPIREGAGDYKIYTGDYSGFVWTLEEASRNDNSNAYYGGFRTASTPLESPRTRKNFKRGWLLTKAQGAYDLQVKWWVDGISKTERAVSLAGIGGVLGSFTLGTDVLGGEDLIDVAFPLEANGKRIQYEVYNSTVNEDFYISQILTDFRELGKEPT